MNMVNLAKILQCPQNDKSSNSEDKKWHQLQSYFSISYAGSCHHPSTTLLMLPNVQQRCYYTTSSVDLHFW